MHSFPGVGMGHSCHVISTRLTRLLFNINIPSPNPEGILSTFGRSIQHWLEEFPTYSVEHHFEYARVSVWSVIHNFLITIPPLTSPSGVNT